MMTRNLLSPINALYLLLFEKKTYEEEKSCSKTRDKTRLTSYSYLDSCNICGGQTLNRLLITHLIAIVHAV